MVSLSGPALRVAGPHPRWWGLLIAFVLGSMTACDPEFTLRVRIVVPPGALEAGGELPLGVFVSMQDPFINPGVPRSLTAVICETQLEPLEVSSKITGAGWHGDRGRTWAWAQSLPEGSTGEPCGTRPNFVAVDPFPALETAWRDSTVVFEHEQSRDTATLVLGPP